MSIRRERTIVELDDPGEPEAHERLVVEGAEIKPVELGDYCRSYRVLADRVLEPGERCAVRFSLPMSGTLFKVRLRWRSVDGKLSSESALDGQRELVPGEPVELEAENTDPRPARVDVWAHVRVRAS